MTPFMQLHGISKLYPQLQGTVYALHNISLTLYRGAFTAIVGQSGSGKSTLMNILGCLDTPTSGEYLLNGQPVARLNQRQLAQVRSSQISFVFQGYHLVPSLNGLENVALPLMYRGIGKKERHLRAAQALKLVGLENRMGHFPFQMSGGQQQRVAIARALAAETPCILADEPTGNLDPQSACEVMQVLHRLHRQGKTVVLITHDMAIANSAQRIVGLQGGQLLFDRPGNNLSS